MRFPRLNSIIISGHVARDLELRYTGKGTPFVRFVIGVSRSYLGSDGNWVDEASFIDIVAWSKLAENCAQKLKKGSPAIIEGYLSASIYTDKDNNQRKSTEIVASRVQFLEKTGGQHDYQGPKENAEGARLREDYSNQADEHGESKFTDDDVPF